MTETRFDSPPFAIYRVTQTWMSKVETVGFDLLVNDDSQKTYRFESSRDAAAYAADLAGTSQIVWRRDDAGVLWGTPA